MKKHFFTIKMNKMNLSFYSKNFPDFLKIKNLEFNIWNIVFKNSNLESKKIKLISQHKLIIKKYLFLLIFTL
jgi:hypothetical protein